MLSNQISAMKQFLIFYLLIMVCPLTAQTLHENFGGGLLFEDETYEQLPRQSPEDGSKADLPVSVDLTPFCPEVRHQGYIFSCVGWAAGYGALSIQRAILNKCTDKQIITRNANSALFLYNQIKPEDCDNGSRISDALNFLNKNGDCLARQFDFDVNNCSALPDSSISSHAKRFAIDDYLTLFSAKEKSEAKIRRVKVALVKNKPVIIGMSLLRNFYELKNAQYWHPSLGNTAPAGGHALVVVGYDDYKGAFRLMNSWGKNWGDNGYIWVKYKDFGDFCKYGYVLYLFGHEANEETEAISTVNSSGKPLLQLSGRFRFRYLNGWLEQTGQPIFDTASVVSQGMVYQLQKKDWEQGQLFQLLAQTLRDEEYLYVFSIDAKRKVHFHWPRQHELNDKFEGMNESALILHNGEVIIPGASKALKIVESGTDRLVILYSKKKIETVGQLAERLCADPENLAHNLVKTLGKYAVPQTDIDYTRNQIGFSAASRADGYIVPIILEVSAK